MVVKRLNKTSQRRLKTSERRLKLGYKTSFRQFFETFLDVIKTYYCVSTIPFYVYPTSYSFKSNVLICHDLNGSMSYSQYNCISALLTHNNICLRKERSRQYIRYITLAITPITVSIALLGSVRSLNDFAHCDYTK